MEDHEKTELIGDLILVGIWLSGMSLFVWAWLGCFRGG